MYNFNLSAEEESRIGIWHFDNRMSPSIRLWPMDEHNFRVSEAGHYTGLLFNPTYILIRKQFITAFAKMDDQVSFKPAVIFDFKLNTETDAYMSMHIVNKISPRTIDQQDFSGNKIWVCDGYVFVSRELKQSIERISGDDFFFSPGFSLFG